MSNRYHLPDLDYEYDALDPTYSAEILELHHSKHHSSYVDGANKTVEALAYARDSGDYDMLNQLQKNLAFNLSGHVLHSLFWKNIGPNGGGSPGPELAKVIERQLGSVEAFREQMSEAALSIQGSGWAALTWDPMGQCLLVQQVYDHQGNIGNGTIPVMVVDMWEHAFYLQFKNQKKRWMESYWDIVRWDDVETRLQKVQQFEIGLDRQRRNAPGR